jgi:hypothetical protein
MSCGGDGRDCKPAIQIRNIANGDINLIPVKEELNIKHPLIRQAEPDKNCGNCNWFKDSGYRYKFSYEQEFIKQGECGERFRKKATGGQEIHMTSSSSVCDNWTEGK